MGGTCAVDLTVMHPELFSTFVDIAGDMGPNAGTKDQTIARIYGGDAAAVADLRPDDGDHRARSTTTGVAGWFAISSDAPTQRKGGYGNPDAVGLGGQDAAGNPATRPKPPTRCASSAAPTASPARIVATPGKHDWPFATEVFTTTLPWLAGQIGTPGVPKTPLPGGGGAGRRHCPPQPAEAAACPARSG